MGRAFLHYYLCRDNVAGSPKDTEKKDDYVFFIGTDPPIFLEDKQLWDFDSPYAASRGCCLCLPADDVEQFLPLRFHLPPGGIVEVILNAKAGTPRKVRQSCPRPPVQSQPPPQSQSPKPNCPTQLELPFP